MQEPIVAAPVKKFAEIHDNFNQTVSLPFQRGLFHVKQQPFQYLQFGRSDAILSIIVKMMFYIVKMMFYQEDRLFHAAGRQTGFQKFLGKEI